MLIALSGCMVFHRKSNKKGLYVRIVNSGEITAVKYKINNYDFPGLKPGDSTQYQFLEKLNYGDYFTVFYDSLSIITHLSDCNKCNIDNTKKVTVYINVIRRKESSNKLMDDIRIDFGR